ncbi:MAG: hypothetical protein GY805_06600 [Chloroflexi bacterium]|nr:hypothetical protein [Chloroflexota bacterium]
MDNIYVIFLTTVPIAMFLGGFFIARQFRSLQNVPSISTIYVQRKWIMSVVMGALMSGIFSLSIFLGEKFSVWNIFAVIIMFLIASASVYFGLTLGWGQPPPTNEDAISINQTQIGTLPNNIIVEDTFNSVKITTNTQKRWGWFVMALFQWVVIGFFISPIVGLLLFSILQSFLPESMNFLAWIFAGGLVLFLIYKEFQKPLEYIADKEIIEIDNLAIKIEQYGSRFKIRKEYSADNIKKITTMFPSDETNVAIKRSPFINSNMPAFVIWHNRGYKRHRLFGRAVDFVDAQSILKTIHNKFPQYKG